MLKDLFSRFYLSSDDAGGSGSNDNPENKENQGGAGANNKEEIVTLKKSELEQRYTNKFAEGAKKAEKTLLEELGLKSKDELKELLSKIKEEPKAEETVQQLKAELTEIKALNIIKDEDIKKEYQGDVIALLKGKGLDLTEENIKAEIAKHPEWKKEASAGAKEFGTAGGKGDPSQPDEKEQARKLFGII